MKPVENKLLNIINEEIKLIETHVNSHSLQRLNQRLDKMTDDNDITEKEDFIIRNTLNAVLSYNFPSNKSYGILLGTFKPNPKSSLYTNKNSYNPGISFYEIYGSDRDEIMKDSTGDEFWAVIRNNEITTVMLRKRLQREFAHNDRMDRGGLGVDKVIVDFNKFIKDEEQTKIQQQQIALNKERELRKIVKINGITWQIDDKNQQIFVKNKPNKVVPYDKIFDIPDWSDEQKEDILNRFD